MKIVVTLNFPDVFFSDLREKLPDYEISICTYDDPNIIGELKNADIVVSGDGGIQTDKLQNAKNLKLLQVPWIGVDRLDFSYFLKNKIQVCNSKWNPKIVAEYSLALMLVCAKKFIGVNKTFKEGSWKSNRWGSTILRKKTVLIIGFGDIGEALANFLEPFECDIIGLKRNLKESKFKNVNLINWDDFPKYAPTADFTIVVLPLTTNTNGILNKKRLKMLKEGSIIVNVGRGKTIVEEDLFNLLKEKHFAGAGLDVWYNYNTERVSEPFYPSKYPFQELDTVLMSPHRSSVIMDGKEEFWDDLIYNISALEKGTELKNKIDLNQGY